VVLADPEGNNFCVLRPLRFTRELSVPAGLTTADGAQLPRGATSSPMWRSCREITPVTSTPNHVPVKSARDRSMSYMIRTTRPVPGYRQTLQRPQLQLETDAINPDFTGTEVATRNHRVQPIARVRLAQQAESKRPAGEQRIQR
jgi:hypothetical protein